MSVAERLKGWRQSVGATQDQFASLIGKHVGMIRKWEGGSATPGGDALIDIATTGVNLHWLLTGEGEMHAGVGAAPSQVQQQTLQAAPALNHELLQAAVEGVAEGLRRINRTVPADKHAQLIAAAYELLLDGQGNVGKNNVINFIRAAA
jgi:transcriptional regulator with XRE-family HTH domain